jgi:sucrose-6-phosphate hydrolase SacC (GH32 family)
MISFDAEIQDSINIVLSNNNNEAFKISYNTAEGLLRLDRSQSGQVDFNEKFKNSSNQTLSIGKVDKLSFKLVLDASSIEIFINDGDYVMTNQIFPTENYTSFRLNKEVIIKNFKINSISHD